MGIVDFREIDSSMDWELFAQAFFRSKGFNIIESPSVGSDGGTGKDLIIEEVKKSEFGEIKRRFLVSCKHYAHREKNQSVKTEDEKKSIDVNLELEKCEGFIGFYSTYPSSTLLENLKKVKARKNQLIEIFDYERIEQYLLSGDKENDLLKRFFLKSYQKWKGLSGKDIEQNQNFKKLSEEDFRQRDKEYFKKYYEGQPADWSIIRKYTFKRDSFDYIIRQLEKNKISLLTGAGGEGKTTLLMQVGDYYLKKDYQVFYALDLIQSLEISELKFKPNKKYLILIDNANTIINLAEFIKKIKLSTGVLVLLAARKNEWDYSYYLRKDSEDIGRWIGKPVVLHRLSGKELLELSKLLKEHKVLSKDTEDKLSDFVEENKNLNFLLSVMIYATKGESFDNILVDVISKIQSWENSELAINSIGYIVCIEILGKGKHGPIYCQETLLKRVLNCTSANQYHIIKKQLAEEAFFQGSLSNTINTRNPIIAKIYFDYLFYDDAPILDKHKFYYDIIREASYSNNIVGKDILGVIPNYFFEKDRELAIQLVKDAISYGFFWNTYYPFIDNEISNGNIGSYDSDDYSACWLFKMAFYFNSKDPQLYTKWAEFELKNADMGDVGIEYSPRWIFYVGMKLAPFDNLFVKWANAEAAARNIGENVDTDYSARWICKLGVELKPSKDIFVTWANIEVNIGNIGMDINDDYSARWICENGINKAPSGDLFIIWANIEVNAGNIGNNIDEEYSARWICNKGINKTPTSDLFATWANIEVNAGNIGNNIDEEYSARWICYQGLNKAPKVDLFNTWANIEVNAGNFGKNIDEKYSARWICKHGYDMTKDLQCLFKLLKIELRLNNFGDSDTPYSAQWLFENYLAQIKSDKLTIKGVDIKTVKELKEALDKMNSDKPTNTNSILDSITE